MDSGSRQDILTNGSAAYKERTKHDRRSNNKGLPFAPWA
jgi:hypothetical protein